MALCINQSGTWRDIITQCVNQSGTWREVVFGCINQSGTWRCYGFPNVATAPLGTVIEGGNLVCRSGGVAWIVAPATSEVSRNWYARNDASTRAQQVSGCTGWFVPTITQMQNPGFACRTYWDSLKCFGYWSSTNWNANSARSIDMVDGLTYCQGKPDTICVRAFRCVTY